MRIFWIKAPLWSWPQEFRIPEIMKTLCRLPTYLLVLSRVFIASIFPQFLTWLRADWSVWLPSRSQKNSQLVLKISVFKLGHHQNYHYQQKCVLVSISFDFPSIHLLTRGDTSYYSFYNYQNSYLLSRKSSNSRKF